MVSILSQQWLRATASLGIAWLAVVLSGCQPAPTAAPTTPTQLANQAIPASTATALATNTVEIKETAIIIAEKLELLEIALSQSALTARLDLPEGTGVLRMELYSQAGQLLGRQLLAAPPAGQLAMQIPYQVSAAQTALLVASQQDAWGRITRLVSAEVSLPAGQDDPDPSASQPHYTVEIAQALQLPSGVLQVSGRAWLPAKRGTLEIRLLDEENRILLSANRFIEEDGSFEFELAGFKPRQEATFLLTVAERRQGLTIALDSLEIRLKP